MTPQQISRVYLYLKTCSQSSTGSCQKCLWDSQEVTAADEESGCKLITTLNHKINAEMFEQHSQMIKNSAGASKTGFSKPYNKILLLGNEDDSEKLQKFTFSLFLSLSDCRSLPATSCSMQKRFQHTRRWWTSEFVAPAYRK